MKKIDRLKILHAMVRIRLVEQYIARRYPEQKMRCPTHLCLGQEAAPAVFGHLVEKEDIFVGTYRSHGHYLAKGGDLLALFAEILGAEKGCSRGYGGSMHILDTEHNFYGTSAIVGAGVPIATGAAYSFKYNDKHNVVICFIGDGAVEEGAVYESVNFAILYDLPIVYVCENNRLAVTTPIELRTKKTQLYDRFGNMGLPGSRVKDGQMEKLYGMAEDSITYARKGKGPYLVEIEVERWATHVGHDYEGPADLWFNDPEAEAAMSCPIACLVKEMKAKGEVSEKELQQLRARMNKEIENTFEKASSFALASNADFESRVYASGLLSKLPKGASGRLGKKEFKHKEQSKLVNPF